MSTEQVNAEQVVEKPKTTVRYGLHFKVDHEAIAEATKLKEDAKKIIDNMSKEQVEQLITSFKDNNKDEKQKVKHTYAKVTKADSKKQTTLTKSKSKTLHRTHSVRLSKTVTGTKRALLIGINYFGTNNELNGCIKDVQNINNLLVSLYNYTSDNITILSDDQQGLNLPTRQNIIDNMNKYVALTKSGDELFIHYSGHGTQVADLNGDEANNPDTPGKDDALCPCDFDDYSGNSGFILDDVLKEIIVDKIPAGAKLRAFFDCCHSGSALDLPFLFQKNEQYMQVEPLDKQSGDCLLVSGCKDNQTSADAYINRQYSGALTWALIQALTTASTIPTTWKQLLLVVRHLLANGRYTQIPMLSVGDKNIANLPIDL